MTIREQIRHALRTMGEATTLEVKGFIRTERYFGNALSKMVANGEVVATSKLPKKYSMAENWADPDLIEHLRIELRSLSDRHSRVIDNAKYHERESLYMLGKLWKDHDGTVPGMSHDQRLRYIAGMQSFESLNIGADEMSMLLYPERETQKRESA